jgi:hypothetical protein
MDEVELEAVGAGGAVVNYGRCIMKIFMKVYVVPRALSH